MDSISIALQNPSPSSLKSKASPRLPTVRSPSIGLRCHRQRRRSLAVTATGRSEHDVVIVGGGIIGLSVARHLLLNSDLSVAVVDANVPCYGATGAGQGYIWMAHLTPGSDTWELARRSKQLWEELVESIERQGMDPLAELGWKKTGSLLIGRTSEEVALLEERVKLLSKAGVRAEYLSSTSLLSKEPALEVRGKCGAAFFPDDCQLDALRTVAFIEKDNRCFASEGRYTELYNNPAINIIRSEKNGPVEGIQTTQNSLYCKQALVVAAGAWTGSLMQSIAIDPDAVLSVPVKPRKGVVVSLLDSIEK